MAALLARLLRRFARSADRGQVIPLVALSLFVLLGAAALAIDIGYLRYQSRLEQTAADAAAVAAAQEIAYAAPGTGIATASAAAKKDSESNGFRDDGTNVTVTANYPPASGAYTADPTAVEVVLNVKHPTFFWNALGVSNKWIQARSVARLGPGNYCVYALKSTKNPAAPSGKDDTLSLNSDTINAPKCGLVSNGSMYFEDSTVTAKSLTAVGAIDDNGGRFSLGRPAHGLPVDDPCFTITGCATLTKSPPATTPCTPYRGQTVLNPGIYCNITLSSDVTFNPGLYVLTGLFFANGWHLTGNGVTFYIAPGTPDNSGRQINLNSDTLDLTAPATGPYAGMLFYQPSTNTNQAYFESCHNGSGAMYFPNAYLHYNSDTTTFSPLIAGWIYMEQWRATFPAAGGATPHAVLAE